jgi:hypothetical protein
MHDTIIVAMAPVYRDILHESVAVITKNGKITVSFQLAFPRNGHDGA